MIRKATQEKAKDSQDRAGPERQGSRRKTNRMGTLFDMCEHLKTLLLEI